MKKKFSLQSLELAEAAVKDAVNFGLSATLEEADGEVSVAYEAPAVYGGKEEKAVSWDDVYAICRSYASEYQYQLKWVQEDLKYTREAFYNHLKGHLPSINDAGRMEKALKSLGLEDSYKVNKPTIYVEF